MNLRGGGPCVVVATWDFGEIAVKEAAKCLQEGKSAVDAAERGVMAVEQDDGDQYYVGYGGLPNSEGAMELDAAIMDGGPAPPPGISTRQSRLGAVCALPQHCSAIEVARAVMEHSPHNILVGQGALLFARKRGIAVRQSLSPAALRQYLEWKKEHEDKEVENENEKEKEQERGHEKEERPERPAHTHDTVGVICLDGSGRVCAGTSTSGWPYKHPGRVGDSPLVGSGLYVDGSVGAAVATGDGEQIMRSCLAFLVVERMREGASPQAACEEAISRLRQNCQESPSPSGSSGPLNEQMHKKLTVGVLALSVSGKVGVSSTLGPHNPHRGREAFPCALWREDHEPKDAVSRVYGAEKTGSRGCKGIRSWLPRALRAISGRNRRKMVHVMLLLSAVLWPLALGGD